MFLDNILIYSDTFEEHIKRIKAVFSRLHEHGLKVIVDLFYWSPYYTG